MTNVWRKKKVTLIICFLKAKVTQVCPALCDPMDCTVPGILQARILEWVAFPFSRGSSQPRDGTQVSALQADSLPVGPKGKPKNTAVGRLSLLQGIFLSQQSNQGLLHCRQILCQLSRQGSPICFLLYVTLGPAQPVFCWIGHDFHMDLSDLTQT